MVNKNLEITYGTRLHTPPKSAGYLVRLKDLIIYRLYEYARICLVRS
jgi:hypothetical protein